MKDIQQLIKKGAQLGRYEDIFPKTYLDAVTDKSTNMSLTDILAGFNMYFLSYVGSKEATRLQVPMTLRRLGLWITYVLYDKTVVTEWYSSDDIDDEAFSMSSNWRAGSNMLVGDISISANGTWVVDGVDTGVKAQGDTGITPRLRIYDNKFQVSYTNGSSYINMSDTSVFTQFRVSGNKLQQSVDLGKTWTDTSDFIAAWFRYTGTTGISQANNIGKLQISRDAGTTWDDLSNNFSNNLHISTYIGPNTPLPTSGIAEGTIYAKGPTYAVEDTTNSNPIYRLWVYANYNGSLTWVDNGEFTSIAAGIVQELGDSEVAVMSQKVTSNNILSRYKDNIISEPKLAPYIKELYISGTSTSVSDRVFTIVKLHSRSTDGSVLCGISIKDNLGGSWYFTFSEGTIFTGYSKLSSNGVSFEFIIDFTENMYNYNNNFNGVLSNKVFDLNFSPSIKNLKLSANSEADTSSLKNLSKVIIGSTQLNTKLKVQSAGYSNIIPLFLGKGSLLNLSITNPSDANASFDIKEVSGAVSTKILSTTIHAGESYNKTITLSMDIDAIEFFGYIRGVGELTIEIPSVYTQIKNINTSINELYEKVTITPIPSGYVRKDGTIALIPGSTDAYYSDFIPCRSGKIFLNTTYKFEVTPYAFYDVAKNFISSFPVTGEREYFNGIIENIPENAEYIRVCSYQPDKSQIFNAYRVPYNTGSGSGSKLKGKKAYFIGDSIMAGDDSVPTTRSITYYLSNDYTVYCTNKARGGAILTSSSKHYAPIYSMLTSIPDDADYIIMQGGVNGMTKYPTEDAPWGWGTISSGFNEPLDTVLQLQCLEAMCKYVVTHFPNKKYGFIITYIIDSTSYWAEKGALIKQVLDKWGIPYLDWRASGINLADNDIAAVYGVDTWTHYPQYSSSSTYKLDDRVIYQNAAYKAKQDISTPEEFTLSHWDLITTSRYDGWHCNSIAYKQLADKTAAWMESL